MCICWKKKNAGIFLFGYNLDFNPQNTRMKSYPLRKCRRILSNGFKLFQKKKEHLSESDQKQLESDLKALDQALLNKNREEASIHARSVDTFIKSHFPKTVFDHLRETAYALAFAIVVVILIKQFWFLLYEVPTGSMRPTIEELDRMVVSNTTFGINFPFKRKPLLFSDEYIQRGGIIVFTVRDMDVADADMLYFRIIPGKKRYIKRCVAKPGDTLYFYGGQIYAIDKEGHPVTTQADPQFLQRWGIEKIDHIPYITQEGKESVARPLAPNAFAAVTLNQMNLPVGKLEVKGRGQIEGAFFNGKEWVEDHVDALKAPHDTPMSYSDLWGIGHYAMARLLTKEQAQLFYHQLPAGEEALLYLELRHTPNLTYPKPELRPSPQGFIVPELTPFSALIPLKQNHLDALRQALYTARFFVKNGRAYRYHEGGGRPQRMEYDPKFPTVPDGSYEFYYGRGYKVHVGGVRTPLPKDHPLYSSAPDMVRKLFNQGIGFNTLFEPMAPNQPYNPQRFAYYRDGDLYVMGAPILKKTDPTLIRFIQSETEKQNNSSHEAPYIAFIDRGPPLKEDGSLNVERIRAFGLKVPDNSLVALGDNYAMSADSRDFGFVPTQNLRGAPSFTFWPPSSRVGPLPQPPYPWLTLPNLIVWAIVALVIIATLLWIRKRNRSSIFKPFRGRSRSVPH
jgi:signal peptidase I